MSDDVKKNSTNLSSEGNSDDSDYVYTFGELVVKDIEAMEYDVHAVTY